MARQFGQLVSLLEAEYGKTIVRAGASEHQIDDMVAALDIDVPESLLDVLRIANGEAEPQYQNDGEIIAFGLFCDFKLLSADEIVQAYKKFKNTLTQHEEDRVRHGLKERPVSVYPEKTARAHFYFDGGWIPFAVYGSAYLAIDLNPGEFGVKGQIINFGADDYERYQIAKSLTDFMDFCIDKYKSKQLHQIFHPDPFSANSQYVDLKQYLENLFNIH